LDKTDLNPPTPSTPHHPQQTVEIVLFIFSVGVLSMAFLMFRRLFDALSPPTKALSWVVGVDVLTALLLLAFMCFQMYYYVRREPMRDGFFCHYLNPAVLALVTFGWLGQPAIAWTTLKTLRNEPVPDRQLHRVLCLCVGIAFIDYVWGVAVTPGKVVNGSFCIMKAKSPGALDARTFTDLIGMVTFVMSVVYYAKSYRYLRRLHRKYVPWVLRLVWLLRSMINSHTPPPQTTNHKSG
jgi:hypothetical protein